MKELIKPQVEFNETESLYEALAESCDTVNLGCICRTRVAFADEDEQDIIF